jgi:hypothetical protein
MMNCPALIYSIDSPLLPVPFTILLDNDKLEVNKVGELDTSKFFKDIYKEHVYVDDEATVVIRRDEQSDFVVSATYGNKMSGKVVMVVNLPEGIAPSDIGLVYDE